jgi:glycosyltransferase involved in cell wall biosynthesis
MRIAIFARNSPTEYSGGRYLSWMMAEALAQARHDITYVTNRLPACYDDFASLPHHKDVQVHTTRSFAIGLPKGRLDLLVLVPGLDEGLYFYLRTLVFAVSKRASLILLSFETPNWFNALSPSRRDPSLWNNWRRCAKNASLILSISAEGDRFARRFYDSSPSQTLFDYCYPPINSVVADSVVGIQREKRIIFMTRFVWAEHKGGYDVTELVCEAMRGHTLVLLVGAGDVPSALLNQLRHTAAAHGVEIEVKYRLTDEEKFREIKRACLMLFPSYFEGFGLPPVEAQYCNVPCIAFDLPVLREVSGDGINYVEPGNWTQFRARIAQVLNSTETYESLHDSISEVACFENYVERMDRIVQRAMETDLPDESRAQRFVTTTKLRAGLWYSLFHTTLLWGARRLGTLARRLIVIVLQGVLPEETYQRLRAYVRGQ